MKGKLIVIDGTDGSGKATHSGLLIDRLSLEGKEAKLADVHSIGGPIVRSPNNRSDAGNSEGLVPHRYSDWRGALLHVRRSECPPVQTALFTDCIRLPGEYSNRPLFVADPLANHGAAYRSNS